MTVFDEATAGEIEALQDLRGLTLPEAMIAMMDVTDIRSFIWRAWVAARHNGHPDATLDDIRALPYLQLLEATAGEVTDGDPAT
jgi:hypothetical protein